LIQALTLPSRLLLNSLTVSLRKILINNLSPHKVEKFLQKIVDKLLILCMDLKQQVRGNQSKSSLNYGHETDSEFRKLRTLK
jgi:hypothetical protein